MKKKTLFMLILLVTSSITKASDTKNGENSFNINCLACHQMDKFTVGPSLVEISKKYPADRLDYFIGWANQPGKVNKRAIQMPSMAHVGDKNLTDIHNYILAAAKGKTEKRKQKNAKSEFKQPKRTYPFTRRAFMPETSPATIGVGFSKDLTLAWDIDIGNIRYAFVGQEAYLAEFMLPKNMNLAGIKYRTQSVHPFSFADPKTYRYIGYKLENNLPEILYQYGDIKISEKLRPGKDSKSFIRHFKITGLKDTATVDFSHTGAASIVSNKGQLENNFLTINALNAQDFSVEVTVK